MDSHEICTTMLRIFPFFIHPDSIHRLLLRVRKNRTEPAGRSLRSKETTDFLKSIRIRSIDIHTNCSMSMNIDKPRNHPFSSGINHLITSLSLAATHLGNPSVLQEKIQRLETMVVVHRCIFYQCFHCKTSYYNIFILISLTASKESSILLLKLLECKGNLYSGNLLGLCTRTKVF